MVSCGVMLTPTTPPVTHQFVIDASWSACIVYIACEPRICLLKWVSPINHFCQTLIHEYHYYGTF
jgi:hypothetical protein